MIVGERIRQLREEKEMSQGDVEKRTGLLRCYISRVENGHTVPAIETLEKIAQAYEVPLWQLLAEPGTVPPKNFLHSTPVTALKPDDHIDRGIIKLLPKISANDRRILLKFAGTLVRGNGNGKRHKAR